MSEINKIKILWISGMIIFGGGFFLGRETKNKIATKTVIQTIQTTQTEKSQAIDVSHTQKDSTLAKQTSYLEKDYSNKGKLTKTISTLTTTGATIQTQILSLDDTKKIAQNTSTSQTVTKTIYQPDWLVGGFLPVTDISNPANLIQSPFDIHCMVEYRLIGNIYIFGETNFKGASVGGLFPI